MFFRGVSHFCFVFQNIALVLIIVLIFSRVFFCSLDVDTKEELILAIEKLLADKTTLVAGSAIYAFEQLCPDRVDLVHKHYRRLCSLLVDVDEWGQVVVANMLIRYAKTQFLDPNEVS